MNSVTCKCGKTKKNFAHLSQDDFGKAGWEQDCCNDISEMQVLQGIAVSEAEKSKKSRRKEKKVSEAASESKEA